MRKWLVRNWYRFQYRRLYRLLRLGYVKPDKISYEHEIQLPSFISKRVKHYISFDTKFVYMRTVNGTWSKVTCKRMPEALKDSVDVRIRNNVMKHIVGMELDEPANGHDYGHNRILTQLDVLSIIFDILVWLKIDDYQLERNK